MSKSAQPFDSSDSKVMWTVLSRWMELLSIKGQASTVLGRQIKGRFAVLDSSRITHMEQNLKRPYHLNSQGWMLGRSLSNVDKSVPVITLQYEDKSPLYTEVAFRVAIFRYREDRTLMAEGWRFEQGEIQDGAAHPYSHAQQIIGWTKSHHCLLHPPPDDGVPACDGIAHVGNTELDEERKRAQLETLRLHPAIPMATETFTGLALAVALTLYGANIIKPIVPTLRELRVAPLQIKSDMDRLGLKPQV